MGEAILKIQASYTNRQCIKYILYLLICLVFGAKSAIAQNDFKNKISLQAVKKSNRTEVVVHNETPFIITVAIRANSKNISFSKPIPDTAVYRPHTATNALSFHVKNKNKSWNYQFNYSWEMGALGARYDKSYRYHLPYQDGTSHRVIQGFNGKLSHSKENRYAVDFEMPVGTPVYAARGGVVIKTEDSNTIGGPSKRYEKYSNYVVIQHADGTQAEYHHLKKNGVLVKLGDHVQKDQRIALSGNTGFSTGPHLHFSVSHFTAWDKGETIPIIFRTQSGTIREPEVGKSYIAF